MGTEQKKKYRREVYIVVIDRDMETLVPVHELWKNRKGEVDRPTVDGPAIISRNEVTGAVTMQTSVRDNHVVDSQGFSRHIRSFRPPWIQKLRAYRPR